jgi:hypothetical protein
MRKTIKFVCFLILIGILILLVVPFPSYFKNRDARFAPNPPIKVMESSSNELAKCKSNVVYTNATDAEYYRNEGFEFIVDDRCAGLQKELMVAIRARDLDSIRRVISTGANPKTWDYSMFQGDSPVQAASYEDVETVKLLLDNGADSNEEYCCCASCKTPLVNAVLNNNIEMVELLLDRGAKVDYKPKFSVPPYDICSIALENRNAQILNLLDKGCGINVNCRASCRLRWLTDWFH